MIYFITIKALNGTITCRSLKLHESGKRSLLFTSKMIKINVFIMSGSIINNHYGKNNLTTLQLGKKKKKKEQLLTVDSFMPKINLTYK